MDNLDNISIGQLYTEDKIKDSGLISSTSWNRLYSSKVRLDKDAQDGDVMNNGVSDASDVFEIIEVPSTSGGGGGTGIDWSGVATNELAYKASPTIAGASGLFYDNGNLITAGSIATGNNSMYIGSTRTSNGVKALSYTLAEGITAVGLNVEYDATGTKEPFYYKLGSEDELVVNNVQDQTLSDPFTLPFSTFGDNQTKGFTVIPAEVGTLRVQYWLGNDDTGTLIFDESMDIQAGDVGSAFDYEAGNPYILDVGTDIFVKFSGIQLKGGEVVDGGSPFFGQTLIYFTSLIQPFVRIPFISAETQSWTFVEDDYTETRASVFLDVYPLADDKIITLPDPSTLNGKARIDVYNQTDQPWNLIVKDHLGVTLKTIDPVNAFSFYFDDDPFVTWGIVHLSGRAIPSLDVAIYGNFNTNAYATAPSGIYTMTGTGSQFSNYCPDYELLPAIPYVAEVTIINTGDEYVQEVSFTSGFDFTNLILGRKLGRVGITFGSITATDWNCTTHANDLVKSEFLIDGFSTATSQEPSGTDTELQIEFGGAQSTTPVSLASNGAITFNEAGSYSVRVLVQYGRIGAGSASIIHFLGRVNGTQAGSTLTARIDNANTLIPSSVSTSINATAGDVFTFSLIRDSNGFDAGGLFQEAVTLAGITDSPSARITISRNKV